MASRPTMRASTSFANGSSTRPPQYRTPSPPRRAVSPLSPLSNSGPHVQPTDHNLSKISIYSFDHYALSTDGYATEGRIRHKFGHGRSNSTIDALATIALATSPTFTHISSQPPSPNYTYVASPYLPEFADSSEPPPKRPRSDKHPPSPFCLQPDGEPNTNHFSLSDSMKGDAELLLNFARPKAVASAVRPPPVRVGGTCPQRESELIRHGSMDHNSSYTDLGLESKTGNTHVYNSAPSFRMRSQSDNSAIISRPIIHGVRPNTSSSTLPPITERYNIKSNDQSLSNDAHQLSHTDDPSYDTMESSEAPGLTNRSPKAEDDTDSSDPGGASCAACSLIRTPTNSDGQEEVTWVGCDGCKKWFHIACAGFKSNREIRTVDRFICRGCRPIHGQTTFVRKSSRNRTAIDYAGLHEGLVKAASDSLEHHYIEPIRQGKIQFLPDPFPRMHPDLVTAEYFEQGSGMVEPTIIPAHLNRRESDFDVLAQDAPTREMFDELLEHVPEEDRPFEAVIDCGQDDLGMVVPRCLTVRKVADLYGREEEVEVIDVKSQQGEDRRWNMQRWADYYENPGRQAVRNVISLEISHSKLGRLVRRPKIVRDLDLQDSVWPDELKSSGGFPNVQLYCLMSVADCYTDFHVDFAGSSVFYRILRGRKTFFFIPPKEKHLKKYEEWCNSPAQDNTFLGTQTKECYRVDLYAGDTMLIPSGWIHAVWTPEKSLVIGGNFLTRLSYGMQIKIAKIEKDTKVPRKFRYPFFQKIQWYAALKYLEEDPIPQSVLNAFLQHEDYRFWREYPAYHELGERTNTAPPGSPYYNSRFYSQAELEGLPELARYLLRTALIAASYNVEGVTADTRSAVKRSIPKCAGDPVDTIRTFGIWVAWKRGNEQAPSWTRPGVIESNPKATEKISSSRPSRRSERNTNGHSYKIDTELQVGRRSSEQPIDSRSTAMVTSASSDTGTPVPSRGISRGTSLKQESSRPRTVAKGSGLGPKRVACDACRKRRIRCRHKGEQGDAVSSSDQVGPGGQVATESYQYLQHNATALDSLAAAASSAGLQDDTPTMEFELYSNAAKLHAATMAGPISSAVRDDVTGPDGTSYGKKGRSKACDDCRKSKRRCIHDEYGRIDPVKAQERSRPRGSISTKRSRASDEDTYTLTDKKPKRESNSPVPRPARPSRSEGGDANAPAISTSTYVYDLANVEDDAYQPITVSEIDEKAAFGQRPYASPPAFQLDREETNEMDSALRSQPTVSLVSPPTSLSDELDLPREHADNHAHASNKAEHTTLCTPNSNSHYSSRQSRRADRYAPEALANVSKLPSLQSPTHQISSMAVDRGLSTLASRSKKPSSRPTSSHAKKGSSLGPDGKEGFKVGLSVSPGQAGKLLRRERTHITGREIDPDTIRAIREIQEEDFGLRRRGTRA